MQGNIVIIGFGSIGSKHFKILENLKLRKNLYLLSSKKLKNYNIINDIKDLKNINPKYIILSNPTFLHYKYLLYLEKNFNNINILVEKPLFEKFRNIKFNKNNIYVAYNIRQHPIINFIKKKVRIDSIYNIRIKCNSYLPNWRNENYKNYYSAEKYLGGGVLLDLSHEIDYLSYLFGPIKIKYAFTNKISNLQISSEDYAYINGLIKSKAIFSLELSYNSRNEERNIVIDTKTFSIKADFLKNQIKIISKKSNKIIRFSKNEMQKTYETQLRYFLNNNFSKLCDFNEALNINLIIDKIKKL